MGRTNPTFRDFLRSYRDSWSAFRRGLRRKHKPAFDRLFDHAEAYADAAGYANDPDPETAVLLSMLLAHEQELEALREDYEQELQTLREGSDRNPEVRRQNGERDHGVRDEADRGVWDEADRRVRDEPD